MEQNLVLIDWLSVTSKEIDKEGFKQLIGMLDVPWEEIKGARGYKDRLYFSGISIHYNGREDMGVWLEMSGQGCRTFESLGNEDYKRIFHWISNGNGDYNLDRCETYVYKYAGNAIDALIEIYGVDEFLKRLNKRHTRQNPKFANLVNEFRQRELDSMIVINAAIKYS